MLGWGPTGPGPGDAVMSVAASPHWPSYVMASLGRDLLPYGEAGPGCACVRVCVYRHAAPVGEEPAKTVRGRTARPAQPASWAVCASPLPTRLSSSFPQPPGSYSHGMFKCPGLDGRGWI